MRTWLDSTSIPEQGFAEAEPNNFQSTANVFNFGLGTTFTLSGASFNTDDKDFFRFTASASKTLTFNVHGAAGLLAQLEVSDQAGVFMFETQPNNNLNSGSVTVVAGRTYFLRLRAKLDVNTAHAVDLALS